MKNLFYFLLLLTPAAWGQADIFEPKWISPSPKAASLGTYSTINTQLSSGTVNTSIPLLKLQEQSLSLDVTLDYQYTGFRPSDPGGQTGLGWNLNAGGVITRTIRGKADEEANGFINSGNAYSEAYPTGQQIVNLSSGDYDGEPDIFSFNFMGHSGKFFFGNDGKIHFTEQNPFKIEYESYDPPGYPFSIVRKQLARFKIRTNDGVTYIFQDIELSRSFSSSGPVGRDHPIHNNITSWYLSKIIGTNGEVIQFTYEKAGSDITNFTESISEKRNILPPGVSQNPGSTEVITNKTFEVYLSKIEGSLWEVNLEYSSKTLPGQANIHATRYFRSLDRIKLSDKSSELKRFEFTYKDESKRHLLRSITEKSYGQEIPPHIFEYYDEDGFGGIYPASIRSIDSWGYFNNVPNETSLIEEYGANRTPNVIATRRYALQKITYPTGGHAMVSYHGNSFSHLNGSAYSETKTVIKRYVFEWTYNGTNWVVTNNNPFFVSTPTTYDKFFTANNGPNPLTHHCPAALTINTDITPGYYDAAYFQTALQNCLNINFPSATWMRLDIYLNDKVIYGYGGSAGTRQIPAGGIRVDAFSVHPSESTSEQTLYTYTKFDDNTYSSGSILNIPVTAINVSGSFAGSGRLFRAEPFNPMSLAPVIYNNVAELKNSALYKRHYFSAFGGETPGGEDNYGQTINVGTASFFNGMPQRFGPADDFAFLRGKPLKTVGYNSSLAKITTEQSSHFREKHEITYGDTTSRKTHAYYYEAYYTDASFGGTPVGILKKYEVSSVWPRLTKSVNTRYSPEGDFIFSDTTLYSYDNPKHKQLTQTLVTLSDGTKRRTVYRYLLDYPSGVHPVYQSMIDSNMNSLPIETLYYLNRPGQPSLLYDASVVTYQSVAGNIRKSNLFVPYKAFKLAVSASNPFSPYSPLYTDVAPASYRQMLHYTHYNTLGNPEEVNFLGGLNRAYLWGYKGQHLIAQADNALKSDMSNALSAIGLTANGILNLSQESTVRGHLNNLSSQAPLSGSLLTLQAFHPVYGLSFLQSPDKSNQYFQYDGLGRLSISKNTNEHLTGHWKYRYKNSSSQNHIITYAPREASTDTASLSGTVLFGYFGGLGAPLQTVSRSASPLAKDIVTEAFSYDTRLRPFKKYLTTPTQSSDGGFQADLQALGSSFYTDSRPFSQVELYDNSPLGRELTLNGSGQSWFTAMKYISNSEEANATDVRLYGTDATGNLTYIPYAAFRLVKKNRTNEQGNLLIQYYDSEDRLIEARQDNTYTAYVYDDAGRVKAVIQPEGYALNTGIAYDSDNFKRYVFFYEYDEHSRIIRKHIPGAGWTEIVYDRADRPVLEQDARQKTLDKWSFTRYDVFARIAFTGEITYTGNRATLQAAFDAHEKPYETWLGGGGWSGDSYPHAAGSGGSQVQQFNFYDQYDFVPGLNPAMAFEPAGAYHPMHTSPKGKLTGTVSYNSDNSGQYYMSTLYYDDLGRLIQQKQTHLKSPNTPNRIDFQYNFAGEVIQQKTAHKTTDQTDVTTLARHVYDHAGRPTQVFYSLNGAAEQEIIKYSYDEIGRLRQKKYLPNGSYSLGNPDYIYRPPSPGNNTEDWARKAIILQPGTLIDSSYTYLAAIDTLGGGTPFSGLQTMDYAWHIRGGLRGINLNASGNAVPDPTQGDLFAYKLDYENAGQWSGNIGKQSWNHVDGANPVGVREYAFTYDPLDRLKSATFGSQSEPVEDYSLSGINYDKNGNILNLQRNGKVNTSTYGAIDNLSYSYSGNRLTAVSDAVSGNHEVDFVPRGSGAYTYWENGALKSDENEQIANITYNTFLNQPEQVTLSDGRWIKYNYDGSGALIKTEYSTGEYWEFTGGLVYKNGAFYQIAIPEGRAIYQGGNWQMEFDYKDHLGNTRVSFKADGTSLVNASKSDFDPWGVLLKTGQENSYQNRFEMQGKESEKTFGLNRINFGARTYNATIGRWDRVDPLAEKFYPQSTHNFTLNNPLNFLDPDGREVISINGGWHYTGEDAVEAFRQLRLEVQNNGGGDDKDKKKDEKKTPREKAIDTKGKGFGAFMNFAFSESGLNFFIDELYDVNGSYNLSSDANPVLKANELVAAYATGKMASMGALFLKKGAGNIIPKGFKKTKEFGKSHGQEVYMKGDRYISRDIGQKDGSSHNGGVWKEFKKVGNRLVRTGTLDENLNRIKK